ncbi:hypothetical protein HAX54_033995, partial [Datura stramonium]|nr:hypothetical protein [Datura stramonium]
SVACKVLGLGSPAVRVRVRRGSAESCAKAGVTRYLSVIKKNDDETPFGMGLTETRPTAENLVPIRLDIEIDEAEHLIPPFETFGSYFRRRVILIRFYKENQISNIEIMMHVFLERADNLRCINGVGLIYSV